MAKVRKEAGREVYLKTLNKKSFDQRFTPISSGYIKRCNWAEQIFGRVCESVFRPNIEVPSFLFKKVGNGFAV